MSNDKKALGKIALKQTAGAEDPAKAIEALRGLSEKFGVPGLDLTQVAIPLEHLDLLPREIATRHGVLPVLVQDERIFLAMSNPGEKRVIDELEFVTGKRVFPYVAPAQLLAKVIEQSYDLKHRGETYYLGPMVPQEVLVRIGLAPGGEAEPAEQAAPPSSGGLAREPSAAGPAPSATPPVARPAPLIRRHSDPTLPKSIVPPKLEAVSRDVAFSEGDFAGGSDLSTVTSVPIETAPSPSTKAVEPPVGGQTQPLVLVVDDDDEIRRLIKRVLVDRNYRVIEADRGTTALRLVKDHVPDALVLDAMLPELHGFEICRRIKGSPKYGHIPIVMISAVYRGWRYAEDVKRNYGVAAYVEKPFRIGDIVKAVEAALAGKKSSTFGTREAISDEAERALQAGIEAYQKGDVDAAITHLRRGASLDPLAYRLHYHLGLLYGKKAMLYEAIQALETAVEINGKHFPALKNLAVLYQKAGFKLKAVETWERALGHAPDDATRQGIKDHLLTLL